MSITDTIQKQAAAVKSGSNAKAIEALQRAIDLLKASEPQRESFAVVKKRNQDAREARLAKFGNAWAKSSLEDKEQILKAHGWVLTMYNKTERNYGVKGKPGYKLTLSADKFTIQQNGVLLVDKTHAIALDETLHQFKSKIK